MSLINWINPIYLEPNTINKLKSEFKLSKNFSHLSIDNLFLENKLREIELELTKERYYIEESDLYKFLRTIDFKNNQNKKIIELRNFLKSTEFIEYIEKITELKLKKEQIDLHSLKLENTHYLLCHDDQVQNRKIAFVINFSNFEEKDGGLLELFEIDKNDNGKIFKKIIPKFNKFNMFEVSNKSYHQISEVISNKERISVSGWFYE